MVNSESISRLCDLIVASGFRYNRKWTRDLRDGVTLQTNIGGTLEIDGRPVCSILSSGLIVFGGNTAYKATASEADYFTRQFAMLLVRDKALNNPAYEPTRPLF